MFRNAVISSPLAQVDTGTYEIKPTALPHVSRTPLLPVRYLFQDHEEMGQPLGGGLCCQTPAVLIPLTQPASMHSHVTQLVPYFVTAFTFIHGPHTTCVDCAKANKIDISWSPE